MPDIPGVNGPRVHFRGCRKVKRVVDLSALDTACRRVLDSREVLGRSERDSREHRTHLLHDIGDVGWAQAVTIYRAGQRRVQLGYGMGGTVRPPSLSHADHGHRGFVMNVPQIGCGDEDRGIAEEGGVPGRAPGHRDAAM